MISHERLKQSRWNLKEISIRKLAATDDLIRFWRSKVKVTAVHQGGKGIHVDDGALSPSGFWKVVKKQLVT